MLALAPTALIHKAIPVRDLPELHKLSEKNQTRIQKLLGAFDVIQAAPSLSLGYEQAAALCGNQRGFTADSLRRLYGQFRKTIDKLHPAGDWRVLVDRALENGTDERMPREFLEEVQRRVDAQHRSVERALRSIRRDWTLGESIPGYGTWQEWWMRRHPHRSLPNSAPPHPAGWSPRNLRNKLDTSKFRRKAQIEGLTSAKSHRPRMKHTRVGVQVGQIKQWDDVEHDFFVNDFRHQQAVRPLELFCHDYAAAYKSTWGMKPKYKDDQGFMKKLSGDMMRLVVAQEYYLFGYHPEGTVNIAEHGTAAFNEDMARTLYDCSGGLITVQESGFDGRAPHAGLYHGRARGQPGHKASLESSNNLVHNVTAHFPGQTGPNKDRRPEGMHGLLTHNAQLLQAYEWLPAEYKHLLDFPLWEIGVAQRKLSEAYHQIATERDHDLEGWLACGHVMQSFEFNGIVMTQRDFEALPPAKRSKALTMIQAGLLDTQPVKKSRWEVWQEGRQHLVKVTGSTVCKLLGETFMKERVVRSHQFHLQDEWSLKEDLWFFGHVITLDGRREELKEGQKYQTFLNPFCPNEMFVRDAKGSYLGIAPEQPIASRGDHEASRAAALVYAKEENQLLSKLTRRQLPAVTAKRGRHQNNAAVLKKAAADLEEKARFAAAALDASLPDLNDENHTSNDHENDASRLW